MKKADLILIAAVIIIAAVFFMVVKNNNANELYVEINCGNELSYYPLSVNTSVTFQDGEQINVLVIENGMAYVSEANCNNQICVHTGPVNEVGQAIFCVPHKFSVTIVSESK